MDKIELKQMSISTHQLRYLHVKKSILHDVMCDEIKINNTFADKKINTEEKEKINNYSTETDNVENSEVLLFFGADILSMAKIASKKRNNLHLKVALNQHATKIIFSQQLKNITGNSKEIWFYDIHGLMNICFDYCTTQEQILTMKYLFIIWSKSEDLILPSQLPLLTENIIFKEIVLTVLIPSNENCCVCEIEDEKKKKKKQLNVFNNSVSTQFDRDCIAMSTAIQCCIETQNPSLKNDISSKFKAKNLRKEGDITLTKPLKTLNSTTTESKKHLLKAPSSLCMLDDSTKYFKRKFDIPSNISSVSPKKIKFIRVPDCTNNNSTSISVTKQLKYKDSNSTFCYSQPSDDSANDSLKTDLNLDASPNKNLEENKILKTEMSDIFKLIVSEAFDFEDGMLISMVLKSLVYLMVAQTETEDLLMFPFHIIITAARKHEELKKQENADFTQSYSNFVMEQFSIWIAKKCYVNKENINQNLEKFKHENLTNIHLPNPQNLLFNYQLFPSYMVNLILKWIDNDENDVKDNCERSGVDVIGGDKCFLYSRVLLILEILNGSLITGVGHVVYARDRKSVV